MKKLLMIVILVLSACASTQKGERMSQKECKVKYTFSNPSLGPVAGYRSIAFVFDDGKARQVSDLDDPSGKKITEFGTPGLKIVLAYLLNKPMKGFHVEKNGSTGNVIIQPENQEKNRLGGDFRIEITDFSCR